MNLLTITNEVLKIKNVSIKCVRILDIVPKTMCHEHCQSKDGQERNMGIRERIERAKKQSEGMERTEHKHRGMDLSR